MYVLNQGKLLIKSPPEWRRKASLLLLKLINKGFKDDSHTSIGSTLRYYSRCPDILDVWIFKSDVSLKDVKIQEYERIQEKVKF